MTRNGLFDILLYDHTSCISQLLCVSMNETFWENFARNISFIRSRD